MTSVEKELRQVAASFGREQAEARPWEAAFSAYLRESHSPAQLKQLYGVFRGGESEFDALLRRVLVGAICLRAGHGLRIGPGVVFQHLETMEFGDQVFIGAQAMLQGRFDGVTKIGSHVWIGPQAYFDARHLVIEDYVGWGPGAKLLGSTHTGDPVDEPIIRTDLLIRPVHIGYGADIGMNASILPGVRVGAHAIVGAGAVVTKDIPEYAVAAGVPARVIRDRREQPGVSQ